MFNQIIVQKALKYSLTANSNPELLPDSYDPIKNQSSVISKLIYDIFGGKILKTHKKKGWHFYNLIENERIDFTKSELGTSDQNNWFEDLPSNPNELNNYFEQEDYSNFFTRFIWAFEEVVGLDKYQHEVTT